MQKVCFIIFISLISGIIAQAEDAKPLFPYLVMEEPKGKSDWGYTDMELAKWGYMDGSGKTIIKPSWSHARAFAGNFAIVQVQKREETKDSFKVYASWGLIDRTGAFVVKPAFDKIQNFSEGFARAALPELSIFMENYDKLKDTPRSGFINAKGEFVIPANKLGFKTDDAGDFSDGLARVIPPITIKEAKKIISDPSLIESITNMIGEDENLTVITSDNPTGFINTKGELAIANRFKYASDFREGLAAAALYDGKCGFIDKKGVFIIKPEYDYAVPFCQGFAIVWKNELAGYIDKKGKIVIETKFEDAAPFSEGLAGVKSKGAYGFIDTKGKLIVKAAYERVGLFSGGLASVANKKGETLVWGFIDKTGKLAIPFSFTGWEAPVFASGLALVQITVQEKSVQDWNKGELVDVNKMGYINPKGEWVYGPIAGPWDISF
jgi:hypothetical protein